MDLCCGCGFFFFFLWCSSKCFCLVLWWKSLGVNSEDFKFLKKMGIEPSISKLRFTTTQPSSTREPPWCPVCGHRSAPLAAMPPPRNASRVKTPLPILHWNTRKIADLLALWWGAGRLCCSESGFGVQSEFEDFGWNLWS